MDIVSSTAETLDVFIEKIHANQKEAVTKALENYDKQLYSSIDHKRFELIRLDERTILSSFGFLILKGGITTIMIWMNMFIF